MAPEQAAADPDIDNRADIYAFGVTAYEMLVGEPPFAGLVPRALIAARMTEDPPHVCSMRPDVPKVLGDLVMRCLERDPDDRPQTAPTCSSALDDPAMVSGAFGAPDRARAARWRRCGDWRVSPPARRVGMRRRRHHASSVVAEVLPPRRASRQPPLRRPSRVSSSSRSSASAEIPANAYLADGITNELASALSRVPGVQVVSPTRAAALLAAAARRATSAGSSA
jgi:serine/threonine-protein kinase